MKGFFYATIATLAFPIVANASFCEVREVSELQLMNQPELDKEFCILSVRELYSTRAYDREVEYESMSKEGALEEKKAVRDSCQRALSNIKLVYRDKFGAEPSQDRCQK